MHRCRTLACAVLLALVSATGASAGHDRSNVFRDRHWRRAIETAQRECKPLFVHVVPDSASVSRHIERFYGPDTPIPADLLDQVIVLVLPADKYPNLRDRLGILEKGGVRSLSPYDLSFNDFGPTATSKVKLRVKNVEHKINKWWWHAEVRTETRADGTVKHGWGTGAGYEFGSWCGPEIVPELIDAPPEALIPQLEVAVRYFDTYAREELPPALTNPDANPIELLGGLRYVETRGLTCYESAIRELLTTRIRSPLAKDIYQACVDALVATTDHPGVTARFLAKLAVRDDPLPASPYCRKAIARLGSAAYDEILYLIADASSARERCRLAILLSHVSGVAMPAPLTFWREAEDEERAAKLDEWRKLLGINVPRVP